MLSYTGKNVKKMALSQQDIRKRNRRQIFDLFRVHRSLTRADLARLTQLSMPSVIKVVDELINDGILKRAGEVDIPIGRKPHALRFNPSCYTAVSVAFHGQWFSAGIANVDGSIERSIRRRCCFESQDDFERTIADAVKYLLHHTPHGNSVTGLGLAVPVEKYQIVHLGDVEERLSQQLGMNVVLERVSNAAAYGEYCVRLRRGSLLYVSLDADMCSSVVMDGRLLYGEHGHGGDIGRIMHSDGQGVYGELRNFVSIQALHEQYGYMPFSYERAPHDVFRSFYDVCTPTCIPHGMIAYLSRTLSPYIATAASIMDCNCVVLGGMLVDIIGEPLLCLMRGDLINNYGDAVSIERNMASEPVLSGMAILVIERHVSQIF